MGEEHDEGYLGAAIVELDGTEVAVSVHLRDSFQPIDGLYHWYGRIAANDSLTELVGDAKKTATLRTPEGTAIGQIGDPDPWHRLRVTGVHKPPFAVPASLADVEALAPERG